MSRVQLRAFVTCYDIASSILASLWRQRGLEWEPRVMAADDCSAHEPVIKVRYAFFVVYLGERNLSAMLCCSS
jgi:hypothetical protein